MIISSILISKRLPKEEGRKFMGRQRERGRLNK